MATPDSGLGPSTSSQWSRTGSNLISLDSDETSSVSEQSSATSSVLDRLKSPTTAEIARKRKVKSNPPPVGKRRSRGNCVSDRKGIEPSKRVREFPNEQLKVSGRKLFCSACREELGLKSSTIQNHIRSQKHAASKKKLEEKGKREQDITQAFAKYNEEEHLRGETLPMEQQVYRVKVVTTFLRAGILSPI